MKRQEERKTGIELSVIKVEAEGLERVRGVGEKLYQCSRKKERNIAAAAAAVMLEAAAAAAC